MNKIIIRKDPKMQYNKHPKTIWITGASSGIGQEFARQFARKGDCRLILTARRKDRLHALADSLSCPCRIEPADLSVPEECERLLAALSGETIDIFINNAGLGTCGNFLETDLEKERTMLRVNVEAMHILFKQVLCQMQKKKRGTIVNVASSAGLFPGGPFMASYYATKSYTVSLTLAVAEELRQKKVPSMSVLSVRDRSTRNSMNMPMSALCFPASLQSVVSAKPLPVCTKESSYSFPDFSCGSDAVCKSYCRTVSCCRLLRNNR